MVAWECGMSGIKATLFIKWSKNLDARNERIRKARTTALRRSAAYVWRVAKRSIRHSNKVEKHSWTDENGRVHETTRYVASPPGKPPFEHGKWWKSSFHFEVDEDKGEAYVGPVDGKRHIAPLHEYGGTGVIRWTRYVSNERVKYQKRHIFRKRPTMQPALDKSKPRLQEFWKNVIN